jgi:hypothetical protein
MVAWLEGGVLSRLRGPLVWGFGSILEEGGSLFRSSLNLKLGTGLILGFGMTFGAGSSL